jgi:exportin-7
MAAVDPSTLGLSGSAADLARIEQLCEQLYASHDTATRNSADAILGPLGAYSPSCLPQCTWILDNSAAPYAQKWAAFTLTNAATTHWSQIAPTERVQLRNYVLSLLANKGVGLQPFVRQELACLLSRITKLGWADIDETAVHRSIVDDVSPFLEASEEHCVIALQFLFRLVGEMNAATPTTRRTFSLSQARKVSLSFRDLLLLQIFNISLTTLAKLQPPPNHSRLRYDSLNLALSCLSYDFVGSSLDDSNEDIGTIHIPISWHTVIEDAATISLFMDTYTATCIQNPDQSAKCLQSLVQLASVRRTLFSTDELRMANISRHLAATLDILRTSRGLESNENYHECCRWLARLKVNYQLDELISREVYPVWIEHVAQFTLQSLAADWSWVGDSLFYLISLWSRLIAAKPYLKGGKKAHLDDWVVKIVEAYVSSRLIALSQVTDEDDDDDDEIPEHLDAIPLLFRLQYERSASFITSVMDTRLENYNAFARSGGIGTDPAQVSRLERELAWLSRVIGAVVSGRLSASSTESQELTDGELSSRVFQLMMYTVDADRASLALMQQSGAAGQQQPGTPQSRARNTKGALALDDAIVEFSQSIHWRRSRRNVTSVCAHG